jgi:hypothetical protein
MRKLSEDELGRAKDANRLFTAVREECGIGDLSVFRKAGIEGPICDYLNNMHTLPEQVLKFCRDALRPDSPLRLENRNKQTAPP